MSLLLIARSWSFECNNPDRQGFMSPRIYLHHGILPRSKVKNARESTTQLKNSVITNFFLPESAFASTSWHSVFKNWINQGCTYFQFIFISTVSPFRDPAQTRGFHRPSCPQLVSDSSERQRSQKDHSASQHIHHLLFQKQQMSSVESCPYHRIIFLTFLSPLDPDLVILCYLINSDPLK